MIFLFIKNKKIVDTSFKLFASEFTNENAKAYITSTNFKLKDKVSLKSHFIKLLIKTHRKHVTGRKNNIGYQCLPIQRILDAGDIETFLKHDLPPPNHNPAKILFFLLYLKI